MNTWISELSYEGKSNMFYVFTCENQDKCLSFIDNTNKLNNELKLTTFYDLRYNIQILLGSELSFLVSIIVNTKNEEVCRVDFIIKINESGIQIGNVFYDLHCIFGLFSGSISRKENMKIITNNDNCSEYGLILVERLLIFQNNKHDKYFKVTSKNNINFLILTDFNRNKIASMFKNLNDDIERLFTFNIDDISNVCNIKVGSSDYKIVEKILNKDPIFMNSFKEPLKINTKFDKKVTESPISPCDLFKEIS